MRRLGIGTFLCVLLILPWSASADLVPCGDEGQQTCQTCHVVDLTNNVVEWLVAFLGVIAAILFVYHGAKLVTSRGNQAAMSSAKSAINNILIGYVIVLGGWLIIDFVLKALLTDDPDFGVWNQVSCVEQPVVRETSAITIQQACDPLPNGDYDCAGAIASCESMGGVPNPDPYTRSTMPCVISEPTVDGGTVGENGLGQCSPANTACSVTALQGYGLTEQEANIMSCIAMTESSGIPSTPPYNETNPGSNSSACGTFQVTRTTWNSYSANISPSCQDFRSSCQNASCNAQLMVELVNANGYSDWTCANCNSHADDCVAQYGG